MRRGMLIAQKETQPCGFFFYRRVNNRLDIDTRLEQRIGEFYRFERTAHNHRHDGKAL